LTHKFSAQLSTMPLLLRHVHAHVVAEMARVVAVAAAPDTGVANEFYVPE
jgi:hypothetical protein